MKIRILAFLFLISLCSTEASLVPRQLKCESLDNPLGISSAKPLLSWVLDPSRPSRRGQKQTAYQILVASRLEWLSEEQADLWNSGKIKSEKTLHHLYDGRPLNSGDFCFWKVRIWDESGKPSKWSESGRFSVGLMQEQDWKAEWIASEEEVSPGPVADRHGFHSLGSPNADTMKWVQVDLGKKSAIERIRLWPARPIFLPSNAPAFLFPVRFRVEVSDGPDFRNPAILGDKSQSDYPSPIDQPLEFPVEAQEGRYVRVVVTRLAHRNIFSFDDYCFAIGELEVMSGGENIAKRKPVSASDTTELGTEWRMEYLTDGIHVGNRFSAGGGFTPPIHFRKEFTVPKKIKRATIHATALGNYHLYLNGKPVSEDHFAPLWSHYGHRALVQTYDVTSRIEKGGNAIAALVGDGWYRMRVGWGGFFGGSARTFGRSYGDAVQRLRVQLELEYSDGSRQVIGTDPSWKWTQQGPYRSSSLYDGVEYDGRMELPGWSMKTFNDTAWKNALKQPPGWNVKLEPQTCEPIRIVKKLKPVSQNQNPDGTLSVDFGQNIAGVCRMIVSGKEGQKIEILHAQAVEPSGRLYTSNLWGAANLDSYVLSGKGRETLVPVFTYHGFRYVEISGLGADAKLHSIEAEALASAVPELMTFETSDASLNQLWNTVLWTYLGNLVSVVTDCAGRDERLGWHGDGQSSWQTLSFAFGMNAFGKKWFEDMRDSRGPDRMFNVFSPSITPGVSPGWSDAGVLVPWFNYLNTGDSSNLSRAFDACREYIDAIAIRNPGMLWEHHRGNDFNDWLDAQMMSSGPDWGKGSAGVAPKAEDVPTIPKVVFATANWARSTRFLSEMAAVLGRPEEAAKYGKLAEAITAAFRKAFVREDGTIEGDTQSTYAFALATGVLTPAQAARAEQHLVKAIQRTEGKLTTGIQTSKYLLLGLTRSGHPDLAYGAAMHKEMPSWRFMLDGGATTIWERFDGFRPGLGFNPDKMNDLNHVGLSSVGEWMIRTLAGLEPDENNPGYKHFFIRPQPPSHLNFTECVYDSVRGKIRVAWKRSKAKVTYEILIPPGTSATFTIPETEASEVLESGKVPEQAMGVKLLGTEKGKLTYHLLSGAYRFEVKQDPNEE